MNVETRHLCCMRVVLESVKLARVAVDDGTKMLWEVAF